MVKTNSDSATPPTPPARHVIGCMTGTSLDGLDAALVRITGTGLGMTAAFVGMVSASLPESLRTTLLSMANGEAHPPIDFMRAARHLGVVHAEACAQLIAQHPDLQTDFIVAHGQTIWHAPGNSPADRLSWQLFDPWPIVRELKLPVCYDLRQADLVAGGEGAPITPIADPILYRFDQALVINLGGICNTTHWSGPSTTLTGRDVSPCNLVIDPTVRMLFPGEMMDRDGRLSGEAQADPALVDRLAEAIRERSSQVASLGREIFDAEWVADQLSSELHTERPAVVLTSVIAAIAESIVHSITQLSMAGDEPFRVILAGGGARNPQLVAELKRWLGELVILSDDLGIPVEAREAMGFAVLGALSADGVPITLPNVTGSENPGVAGVWACPRPNRPLTH